MAVCSNCGYKVCEAINITVTDANGSITLCPTCLAIREGDSDECTFVESNKFYDDITGLSGAILYEGGDEHYSLNAETFHRLVYHHLTPNEWKLLVDKYGEHCFMLHGDFYDDNGIALQPMDEE